MSKPQPPNGRVSPDYPRYPSSVPRPIPRWTERVRLSIASPFARPSPNRGRVGVHIFTFEACSDFTRVAARWIAQPPKAAFVTRLRPSQSPSQAARQLPDQSTTLWVEPTSTGTARPRGAPLLAGNFARGHFVIRARYRRNFSLLQELQSSGCEIAAHWNREFMAPKSVRNREFSSCSDAEQGICKTVTNPLRRGCIAATVSGGHR